MRYLDTVKLHLSSCLICKKMISFHNPSVLHTILYPKKFFTPSFFWVGYPFMIRSTQPHVAVLFVWFLSHTHTPAQTYMQVFSPSCIVKVATCFPIFSLFVPYAWNYLLFIGWECELFGSWTLKVKCERACFAWSLQRSPVNKCSHAGNCSI